MSISIKAIQSFCKASGVKNILQSKQINSINFRNLKYAPLETDTLQLTKIKGVLTNPITSSSHTHYSDWFWDVEPPLEYADKALLYIDKVYASGNGSGTKEIKKIVAESLANPTTQGRVALSAECLNSQKGHPLGFYYKLGFRSVNEKYNKACEKWLAAGGKKEMAPGIYKYEGLREGKGLTSKMYLPKENIEHCLEYGN